MAQRQIGRYVVESHCGQYHVTHHGIVVSRHTTKWGALNEAKRRNWRADHASHTDRPDSQDHQRNRTQR